MRRLIVTMVICVCAVSYRAAAQSFDLRPQQQQTKSSKKVTEQLAQLLDANDVSGMKNLLKEDPSLVNANSLMIKSASGAKHSVPLFFEAVVRAMKGNGSAEMCQAIIDAGCELDVVFDGTTPIYVLMDFIATHPKSQCQTANKIIAALGTRKDFDANKRYRSEQPPLNYLIRRNYEFLGKKFSSDYISDEVLKTLIEHGASVTSYTEEGSSLMTFAIDTNNKYLQSYFIKEGVNLRHNDAAGNDAVHHAIEQGDLSLLKQMINDGGVDININSFHNDTKKVAAFPDMYNYLAEICGKKAQIYEDLVLFRQRFSDKHSLVQQKYEALCQSEVNKAEKFKEIMTCVERYPDLTKITDPKKKSIYQKDCQHLDNIYGTARSVANSGDMHRSINYDAFVNEFIKTYSSDYHYDPSDQVSKAKDLKSFYDIHHALTLETYGTYIGHKGGFFLSLLNLDGPTFDMRSAQEHKKIMENGLTAYFYKSDFKNYQKAAEPLIRNKYDKFIEKVNQDINEYNEEVASLNAKRKEANAYYEKKQAEKKAKEEHDDFMAKNANASLSAVGITYKTSNWKKDWVDSFFMTADHNSTFYLKVEYSDGKEGKIIKYPNTNLYLPAQGEGFLIDDTYETLEDAIAAEYFFHYGATRYKGRKGGF